MKLYNTKMMPGQLRSEDINGIGGFTECEHCGYEDEVNSIVCIRYYERYKKILCDRCVDNFDGITPWSDKLALEHGLPPFKLSGDGTWQ